MIIGSPNERPTDLALCFAPPLPGIYSIYIIETGDTYIGSAINIKKRLTWHMNALRRGGHHTHRLQVAFNKLGEWAFWLTALEWVQDPAKLELVEQQWMDRVNPSLNSTLVAERSGSTYFTDESRAKISAALKGRKKPPFTKEHRQNLSLAHLGHKPAPRTPEGRAKLIAASTGRKRSEETRRKLRESHLGFKITPETKIKMRASRMAYLKKTNPEKYGN